MNQNLIQAATGPHADAPGSDGLPSEAMLAADEFASHVREGSARLKRPRSRENYEVRPCTRVRGWMLRLPITGWTLWHPTTDAALRFAQKLAGIHGAGCSVYDAEGRLSAQVSEAEFTTAI